MSGNRTPQALIRREAVLVALLAFSAALIGLASPVGLPWLRIVGAATAVCACLGRILIALRAAQIGDLVEGRELERRTRGEVAPVTAVSPTDVGVDPAAQSILPGDAIPEYISRAVDVELRRAIRAALDGSGPWMVVAVGSSKVGKSRSLFEALRSTGREPDLGFVAPVDGAAIRSMLASGLATVGAGPVVLWLDDLEPFVGDGVTLQILREWHKANPQCIVAATYGGKGSERVGAGRSGELVVLAQEILQQALRVPMDPTSANELDAIRARVSSTELQSIEMHGLAAFLVAGPLLEMKLSSKRHAVGEPESPDGLAIVRAVVDWARCGRTDPISREDLKELWTAYVPADSPDADSRFDSALTWALRPVAGAIALVQEIASYRAYDYVVQLFSSRPGALAPSPLAWQLALKGASGAQAFAVADVAYSWRQLDVCELGFRAAAASSTTPIAVDAIFNLGVLQLEAGDFRDAIATYDEVLARFGEAGEGALRKQVAGALLNKGVALRGLGRVKDAIATYDELLARFGEDRESTARESVASGLVNKGNALIGLGRAEQAIAVSDELLARFGEPSESELELRKQVANALVNKGNALVALDRFEDAIATFDEVFARFGEASESELREPVARALVNKGVAFSHLDRAEQAIATFDQVFALFGQASESALRELVANALVGKGVALSQLDRAEEAITAYDELIALFGRTNVTELREPTLRAFVGEVALLRVLGRHDQAAALYSQATATFGDAQEPPIRSLLATLEEVRPTD
jgi:tetratricopeptide (TPR) repeat protein